MTSHFKVNPFAPVPKNHQTPLVSTGNIYEPLVQRAMGIANEDVIKKAIESLKARLGGVPYSQEHFGRLELINRDLIDINI